jgi:hypothetical protein
LTIVTPVLKKRTPGGTLPPTNVECAWLTAFSIGPPWQSAQMPAFEGGAKGASARNVRPRFSAAVTPGGSSGGGPPAANALNSSDEKNCGSVRWNSAIASSSALVGSTVF